jgi:hypothetical protein
MTLSINGSSMYQKGEKRRSVITLSSSNQPADCSFLRQAGATAKPMPSPFASGSLFLCS